MGNRLSGIIYNDIRNIVGEVGVALNKLDGGTLLVTGASGLIGSYFLDTVAYLNDNLLKKPCRIIALQRKDPRDLRRLQHLVDRKDIKFLQHDVRVPYELDSNIDYIIHSAGMSAPASFQEDPLGTIDVNVDGIRWILEYARKNDVKSVLYMSSGETYGNPTSGNIPTPETYAGNVSTLSTRACYSESKRLAETLCSIYFRKFGVPVKIARPFVIYGPGLTLEDKRVLADFICSGIEGRPIEMLSEGLDTRSYCYISDAVTVFWKILLSDYNGDVFNVANDLEEVRIARLAEVVHSICGISSPVTVKTKEKAEFIADAPTRVNPNIDKIRKAFSFSPKVGIKEGVRKTIDWIRECN